MEADKNTSTQKEFKNAAAAAAIRKQEDAKLAKKLALAAENAEPINKALVALSEIEGINIEHRSYDAYFSQCHHIQIEMGLRDITVAVTSDNLFSYNPIVACQTQKEFGISLHRAFELIATETGDKFPDQAAEIDKAMAKVLQEGSNATQQIEFKYASMAAAVRKKEDAKRAEKLALAEENAKPINKALKALSKIEGVDISCHSSAGFTTDCLNIKIEMGLRDITVAVTSDNLFSYHTNIACKTQKEFGISLHRTLELIASETGDKFPDQAAEIDKAMAKALDEHANPKLAAIPAATDATCSAKRTAAGPAAAFAAWSVVSECTKKHPETAELPDAAYVASAPEQNNKLLTSLFGKTAQNDTSSQMYFKEPRDSSGQLPKRPSAKRML